MFDATNFVGTFPSVLLNNVGSELFHKDKKICPKDLSFAEVKNIQPGILLAVGINDSALASL